MKFVSDWLVRLGSLGLVVMTAVVGWQVFGRFILDNSPSWTEQTALLLMIWYVLFAAAAGVREGFHIRIALLDDLLGARGAAILHRVINVLVALMGLAIAVYGAQLLWTVRDHVIPSLGLSRWVAYAPLPISGLLMAVFAVENMFRPVTDDGLEPDPLGSADMAGSAD
ncbi:TRAP transporter small permease [Croceicoccus marinus]|nr:TRAP transporter small permease [Croceicoccus marinus]